MEQTTAWIVGGLGTVVAGLSVWAWNHTHKRIDDVWKATGKKANDEEMTRQRGHISGIFDRLGKLEVSAGKLETQMERVVLDMENERQTRSTANELLHEKLDRVLDRLTTHRG